ncbi:MAG: bifunctional phosphoribosylaminoimidazolecarboxamide formyltransferase/IMP cyclohydrolase [Chloroflexota bacterium]|nr:bifunctional phosphoribosylaminoimidazolecarboxamide formyltransferase/IMP cyclohydrolase [Chloroflexota bacterium]
MKALLSVYDKTGIVEFSQKVSAAGYELISTGGTQRALSEEGGLNVDQVADVTGSPEILDGRVKTLHPTIYAGLLARRDSPDHMGELKDLNIDTIDLVVVNLYPFVETISKADVTLADALENIDIGGPTMLRAASKNFPSVAVVVDPADYGWVGEKLANGGLTVEDRRGLAGKAFHHVSTYDSAVTGYLLGNDNGGEELPESLTISLTKISGLRYGENPHQSGALYSESSAPVGMAGARQLHGRELSYNNLMDADAAWRTASDFPDATVSVVKHANSCGLASRDDIAEAYLKAYEGDTVSAFGGIVAFNRTVTAAAAEAMEPVFYEVVIAPDYEPAALEILQKKRNLRILAIDKQPETPAYDLRPITGGILVQTADAIAEDPTNWTVATQRQPTKNEMKDLAFAWKAAKHIKSNAIVFAKDLALVGMGAGQPNRVVSVHLSQRASGDNAKGSVLASDAFFPFADNIELAAEAGITAIVQPGGSIRDDEVIAAADKAGLAMVFTAVRHFRH